MLGITHSIWKCRIRFGLSRCVDLGNSLLKAGAETRVGLQFRASGRYVALSSSGVDKISSSLWSLTSIRHRASIRPVCNKLAYEQSCMMTCCFFVLQARQPSATAHVGTSIIPPPGIAPSTTSSPASRTFRHSASRLLLGHQTPDSGVCYGCRAALAFEAIGASGLQRDCQAPTRRGERRRSHTFRSTSSLPSSPSAVGRRWPELAKNRKKL